MKLDALWLKTPDFEKVFSNSPPFRPFPKRGEREIWKKAFGKRKDLAGEILKRGYASLQQNWPNLFATDFLDYTRTGNRSRFDHPYLERRQILSKRVMACCLEDNFEIFGDACIDAIWSISEEVSWCLPAHANQKLSWYHGRNKNQKPIWQTANEFKGKIPVVPLPDEENSMVDILACDTAALLAEACYLLEEDLDRISPNIRKRIHQKINQRILKPMLEDQGWWWLEGRNNWTPWCCNTIFLAACYLEKNVSKLARLTRILFEASRRYLEKFPEDGHCDEGLNYWTGGPLQLFLFMETIREKTGGEIDLTPSPSLRKLSNYPIAVHLGKDSFFVIADCPPQVNFQTGASFRFAKRSENPDLSHLILSQYQLPQRESPKQTTTLMHALRNVFWTPEELVPDPTKSFERKNDFWFPNGQILTTNDPKTGVAMGVKGGNNGENHNHNDLGQFVISVKGEPFLVDTGVVNYSKDTFGSKRYTIWNIRSAGHNVPIINGFEQNEGKDFSITDYQLDQNDESTSLMLELSKAYPAQAEVKSLERRLEMNRKKGKIFFTDSIKMNKGPVEVSIPFYSPCTPSIQKNGVVRLESENIFLFIKCTSDNWEWSIEKLPDEYDTVLRWGGLYRILASKKVEEKEVRLDLEFSLQKLN